jgi:hypothetical protein
MDFKKAIYAAVAAGWFWGCASLPGSASSKVNITPSDRLFLKVAPFDSVVKAELTRVELDPEEIHDDLISELRYQLFLARQEESPDSAGATVRVAISFSHLQPGTGNSGDFMMGTLLAEKDGKIENTNLELRRPAGKNVPGEFLSLQWPRSLAAEILSRMRKKRPRSESGSAEFTPPLMLLF